MGTQKTSGKERKYVQRKLEEPVEKVVDQKLNDPFIATKKGEREATEELQKGVDEAARKKK
jgi:hypothetical protein